MNLPNLTKQAELIKNGEVVIMPTETVYGIGANALDAGAVAKIFKAKGRPQDNPLIVHISSKEMLGQLVQKVGETEQKLIESFWPGPLTIIFQKTEIIPYETTAGLETVGIRMPDNAIATELISKAGVPIAAPSANISGKPSATSFSHIEELTQSPFVASAIDGGESVYGIESTVVKVTEGKIQILRHGAVTKEDLVLVFGASMVQDAPKTINHASPGTRYKHYAIDGKLKLINTPRDARAKLLATKLKTKIGVIATTKNLGKYPSYFVKFDVGSKEDLKAVASNIFKALNYFDHKNFQLVFCEKFPKNGVGKAIMDRLEKAAKYSS